MKKARKWIAALLVLVLAAGWFWRYTTMNAYYNSFVTEPRRNIYQIGEEASFNDGYSLLVNRFEIVDYDAYFAAEGLPEPVGSHPEKLALVYVTLENVDSDAEGVMLTNLDLVGVDNNAPCDWDVLTAANPILEGNYGSHLDKGVACDLVLPFSLWRDRWGGATWRHFGQYSLFLNLPASSETFSKLDVITRIQVQ